MKDKEASRLKGWSRESVLYLESYAYNVTSHKSSSVIRLSSLIRSHMTVLRVNYRGEVCMTPVRSM